MTKIVPLYPWPMHEAVAGEFERITDELGALGGVVAVQAVPGGPAPVVCVGKSLPPWATDVIQVVKPSALRSAVEVALGDPDLGVRFIPVSDRLADMFGVDHEEVKPVAGATGS